MFRKIIVILTILMISLLFTACKPDNNIVISDDYMSINCSSQKYNLVDYEVDMPDDCYEMDASVENENFLYYLLPLFYDKVYLSNSTDDYVWLSTTTDCTDNENFEEIANTHTILTYKIDK